ncbi:MAG: alpha/beta fold hydrolase [Pseudomonadota bacterium]
MSRKYLVKPILRTLLLIATMLGALYFLQDSLLHFPEPIEHAAALAVARELRLTPWPDATETRGWLRQSPRTTRGTILLFHGNGGHALHRGWFADEMETHGYRTLLAEYPGYGHRSGSKDEASLAADASATLHALRQQFAGPLFVAGESLGAGVAAAALARASAGVDGVLLITPWNNLTSVASHYYPHALVRLVLRDGYDSVTNLRGFMGPKLVLVAGRDTIIPAEYGRALYAGLGARKKLMEIPGVDHNDWLSGMRPDKWREMLAFLEGA